MLLRLLRWQHKLNQFGLSEKPDNTNHISKPDNPDKPDNIRKQILRRLSRLLVRYSHSNHTSLLILPNNLSHADNINHPDKQSNHSKRDNIRIPDGLRLLRLPAWVGNAKHAGLPRLLRKSVHVNSMNHTSKQSNLSKPDENGRIGLSFVRQHSLCGNAHSLPLENRFIRRRNFYFA